MIFLNKKEEFKNFLRSRPHLVEYIKNKEMTLQTFYEIYDVYGENEEAWKPYEPVLNTEESDNRTTNKISDIFNYINVDELQKHIETAKKALSVVEDLTKKTPETQIFKGPLQSRPLNKFFED